MRYLFSDEQAERVDFSGWVCFVLALVIAIVLSN